MCLPTSRDAFTLSPLLRVIALFAGLLAALGSTTPLLAQPFVPSVYPHTGVRGFVDQPLSTTILALYDPISYAATGLPPGLSVNPTTGAITGTPNAAGAFVTEVSATNAAGTGRGTILFEIAVPAIPVFENYPLTTAALANEFRFFVAATGNPTSYAAENLPAGLNIDVTTGLISGIPQVPIGHYLVPLTATNHVGSAHMTLTLSVVDFASTDPLPITPPVILQQPQSAVLRRGTSHWLSVGTNATKYNFNGYHYRWFKDGVLYSSGDGIPSIAVGHELSTSGEYYVVVSTRSGTVTSETVRITVLDAPRITAAPSPRTVAIGATITFSVTATGSATLAYEWTKDGAPLGPRATASTNQLTISNVQPADAGRYQVNVRNAVGSDSATADLAVIPGPQIVRHPESRDIALGAWHDISVSATGGEPLSYQWFKDGQSIFAATRSVLRLEPVTAAHAGTYTVSVTNVSGSVVSQPAVIRTGTAPTITSPLAPRQVAVGTPFTLTIAATGDVPLTYRWSRNNVPIPGATNDTLVISNPQTTDTGDYTAVVSNTWGGTYSVARILVTSTPVNITFNGPLTKTYDGQPLTVSATTSPPGLPVQIRYSRLNGFSMEGPPVLPGIYYVHAAVSDGVYNATASAELRINAVTLTPTILGLQQVYDGKPKLIRASVPNGDLVYPEYINAPLPIDAGVYRFRLRLAEGSLIALPSPNEYLQVVEKAPQAIAFAALPSTLSVGAPFSVAATSTSGLPASLSIVSGNATLTGTQLTLHDTAPVTLRATQPGDRNHHSATETLTLTAAKQPQTISFAALPDRLLTATPIPLSATASAGLPVTFEIAGGPATISGTNLVFTGYEGIVHVRAIQAGNTTYNAAASVVRTFSVLTAPRPFITAQPVSRTVQWDQTVTLSIGATAPGSLSYVWLKNGKPINWGPFATSSSTIRARPESAGTYSVAVYHGSSWSVTNTATITVVPAPSPDAIVPVITNQPTTVSYALGERMSLSVSHTGFGMYQWFKDGQPLPFGTEWRYEGAVREIASMQYLPIDAGSYHVVITNSAGSAASAPIAVTTSSAESSYAPPVVSEVATETWTTVGGSVRLFVIAHGSNLTYLWTKDGVPLPGGTTSEFTLTNAQLSDTGRYGVVIRRGTREDSASVSGWSFDVAVRSGTERGAPFAETPPPGSPDGSGTTGIAPSIVAAPLDAGFDPGMRAVLSVTAEGTAPLSYQWRRENVLIAGATNSTLVFENIQTSDAAHYTVEVRNPFGQTSATARIQVSSGPPSSPSTPPAITRQPTAQTVTAGATAIFTVDVTGAQPLIFQWRKNGVPLPDGKSRILTLYNVQPDDAGNYEVAIANPLGGVTSVPATLTVTPVSPPPPPPAGTWTNRDIGGTVPAGSVSDSAGSVTLRAAGADIWDVSDAFHFRYQSLTGDGEIVARVTALDDTHAWAKAGVMIRESLEPGARNAFAMVNSGFVAFLQSRSASNGQTAIGAAQWLSAPRWLRLVRSGSTLAGFQSDDGAAWTSLGSLQLELPATIYIGLAVTSHLNGTLTTAVFDNVTLSGTTTPPPPPPPPPALAAPTSLVAAPLSSSAISLAWVDASDNETGFELQRSTDGTSFTTFLSVGAGVTTANATGLSAGTAYTFRVRALRSAETSAFSNTAIASTLATPTPPSPPAGTWQSSDIGGVAATGSATESSGVITLAGSGADIWDSADEFRFRHQPWSGDGEIVVRVTDLTDTHVWAKAGLMFREDLSPSARHVFLALTPNLGVFLQRRTTSAGSSDSTNGAGISTKPRWLRLVRAGNTFTGYESSDGATWSPISSVSIPLPASIFVGLAVTSHNDGTLATATFDNLTLTGGGAPPPPPPTLAAPTNLSATATSATTVALSWLDNASSEIGYEIERSTDNVSFNAAGTAPANATSTTAGGLAPLTTYYFRVRAVQGTAASLYSTVAVVSTPAAPPPSQPGTWNTLDIGAVSAAGSASESAGIVTLQGSGADIWDNADEFRFRYQSLAADGEIVARVTGLTNTHPWAKAGLMLRESLAADSRHAFVCITPSGGVAFQRRLAPGGGSESSSGTGSSALPRWLRLVRIGANITAYESTSGGSWTPVGTLSLATTAALHVGLAVTSHNDGTLATATFDNLTVTSGTPPGSTGPSTPPPSTAISAPSNLVATAVSSSQIDLTWNDNSDNETDFRLERSTDNATFTLIPPNRTPVNSTRYSDTGLIAGTTYYYRIRALGTNNTLSGYSNAASATTTAAPPPPPSTAWSNADVGAVGVAGSIEIGTTSVTVRGSGADIWDNADAFRFLYRTLPGDCTVEAQVASVGHTNAWAKAGIMIRESLAPGARNVFLALTPTNGVAFQQRQIAGDRTYFTPGPWGITPPYWVRLVRSGTQVTAYISTNGTTWAQLAVVTFPTGSALVGFAVTSHDNTQLTTAVFNDPFIQ